ncbi:tRNA (adenosine(37)-N6)-threonylcarbamoyltransferase complex dimerization subunit type 1 TsaB [Algibacillus agarilyticus]|uniref:tRNA (adenosine(37)-N6)-threonylcarbamoyltransferase complex dimerization subunit type 1 TsaB n=1 Tax=Algibacillus agarilyticus TaxID=2234133 RepID=UPI000DD00533|nr:tRNA (adenosine(37)-N6)-threonylcarbamoyltransferase complex dimerization subunit type 1 TsaB [Algibacillus agarilyticus]
MSVILALDTSTEACSAAIITDNAEFSEYEVCPREHNQKLLAMVEKVLADAQLTLDDVDAIAYGSGPGSFTGVRITTGIVQGLAYGAQLPVIGVGSLAAMAHGVFRRTGANHIISAIDARMAEIYLGAYHITELGKVNPLMDEVVTQPHDSINHLPKDNWTSIGTGWQTYKTELLAQQAVNQDSVEFFPHALDIALIGKQQWAEGDFTSAELTTPTYLRNEVTWKKMPGK